jgi:putative peptidoglycan lipid II flippase
VQLPAVMLLARKLRARITPNTKDVLRNFVPVFFSRGVVQISGYIDAMFASLLGQGAVTALANAQMVGMLPISLFGMAVSAAELPAMSSGGASDDLRRRLDTGLLRIAVLVVPSAMAFAALGDVISAALFENGEFRRADSLYVWGILAGSAVGLLASTLGRLYSSAYYSLRDTRTPLRFAIVRVVLTTGLGWLFAFPLELGVPGLTVSAGIAGWIEFALLRRSLNRRIGSTGVRAALMAKLWLAAALAAAAAWGVKLAIGLSEPIVSAVAILGVYCVVYFSALKVLERNLDLLPRLRPRGR